MITVTNIRKTFGDFTAVNNLSFQIKPGDVVGFLGPNGAGKSTTMKMLTGFLSPDSGEIRIADMAMDESRREIQKRIGYLPEGAPAYGDMTPIQMLNFIADIRGLQGEHKLKRIADVIAQVQLQSVLDKPIDNLSKGFKRRVGLAQAILHDPEILILDEPTDGLDPNQKHHVRELIKNLSKDKLVIVSTHILEEVTAVCNRAMIIAGGQMLFDSTPLALQQRSRYFQAVSLQFDAMPDVEAFKHISGVAALELDHENGILTLIPVQDAQEPLIEAVSRFMQDKQLTAKAMFVEQGRLDDVFRELTEEVAA
ncbi:ABC transporter ATP-binding protein [Paraneptunicella aestuarii]|uniref:ABC transporter ATP-binding protein n=1 Tax=Paraneptunicella aestuarii TaxID=2831148 RepID=UPI001E588E75|nr:ABC transporter ATP-binding protein [Paraneptunicella aestuarii]UAA37807.1 ABC transporter ATP-binding protein [Paraneptunicella aestuarii]